MKRNVKCILKIIFASLILGTIVSCGNPAKEQEKDNPVEKTELEKKIEEYKLFLGTWKNEYSEPMYFEEVVFAEDSVNINGKRYAINLNNCLYYGSEVPKTYTSESHIVSEGLYLFVMSEYIYLYHDYYTPVEDGQCALILRNNKNYFWDSMIRTSTSTDTTEKGTGTGGGDSSAIKESLLGTWNFNGTGNQLSGKFTFNNDGTYTYSGSKSGMPNGKYTVSGNVLTMKYTKNVDVSEEFDVTISGNTMKLKSHNSGVSTVLSAYFGITGLEATFTK